MMDHNDGPSLSFAAGLGFQRLRSDASMSTSMRRDKTAVFAVHLAVHLMAAAKCFVVVVVFFISKSLTIAGRLEKREVYCRLLYTILRTSNQFGADCLQWPPGMVHEKVHNLWQSVVVPDLLASISIIVRRAFRLSTRCPSYLRSSHRCTQHGRYGFREFVLRITHAFILMLGAP